MSRRFGRRYIGLLAAAGLIVATGGIGVAVMGADNGGDQRGQVQKLRHEPGDAWLTQRTVGGVPEPGAYQRALAQARALERVTLAERPDVRASDWRFEGPENVGGRLLDIVLDPASGTLWVAAASGGVWRSDDGGATFERSWPDGLSQAVGALARGSDGTLWAGTGETNPGGGSSTYAGTGVYRSTDNGATWQFVGLPDSRRIARIVVDPSDPRRVFAAVSGDLFVPGGERGVYLSTDAGGTWTRVLAGATPTAGAADIAVDPENPDRVYAMMWDHQRTPELRRYTGTGSRAYRSVDGGLTWSQMTDGLPPVSEDTGRMAIAVAPSNPDRLYLIHVGALGRFDGFFTSTDAGETWTRLRDDPLLADSQSVYGWWFGRIWVSPRSDRDVWVGGVPLVRSRNAGRTWRFGARGVHVDQHAMLWDPRAKGRIYLGNDGGFYRTDDDGRTWVKATVEPYTQFYTLDVGQQDPSRIVGGTQDNGSLRSYGGEDSWNSHFGGDGEENLINPQDQQLVYACFQYGNCARSEDGGDTMMSFTDETTSDRRNWKAPLEFDPNDPSIMYYGGNILNRSTDAGKTWEAISPDLTGGPGDDPQYPFGTLTTVAAAASDPQRLYVGTDDARVWTSPDLGDTWTRVDDTLPDRWVTRVRVDPRDAEQVYATFSGFRRGDAAAHVYRSRDGGESWQNVSGQLPNSPVNDLVLHGRGLIVATDVGVFASPSGNGQAWFALPGLPLTPVTELRVHEGTQRLYASTFGRGIYSTPLPF